MTGDERPRRRRGRKQQMTLSTWIETVGAHECDKLCDAIQDGTYIVRTYHYRRTGRTRLVLVPRLPFPWSDFDPACDRLQYCPFCGVRIKLVDAPEKLKQRRRGNRTGLPKVPDTLPEDLR
ncbi:MAG: hypothetical protein ACYTGE_11230 [Planctomycetota bacterium]|jgi:hypothetical protein